MAGEISLSRLAAPQASQLVDWPSRARDVLARFRADYGRHAGNQQFVQLVERLKSASAEFAQWWPRHDVRPQTEGLKRYDHAVVGRLHAEHVTFAVSDNPELKLIIIAPAPRVDQWPGCNSWSKYSECGLRRRPQSAGGSRRVERAFVGQNQAAAALETARKTSQCLTSARAWATNGETLVARFGGPGVPAFGAR